MVEKKNIVEDFESEIEKSGKTVWDSVKGSLVSFLKVLVKSVYNVTLGLLLKVFTKANKSIDKINDKDI